MRNPAKLLIILTLACLAGWPSTAAADCLITPQGSRDIIRGADLQVMSVKLSTDCNINDTITTTRFQSGEIYINATIEKKAHDYKITFGKVKESLPLGEVVFAAPIGTNPAATKIALNITEISIANSTVTYVDIKKDITRSQQHRKMPPAPIGSGLPIAVANPILASYKKTLTSDTAVQAAKFQVVNHAYLSLPSSLSQSSTNWKISAVTPSGEKLLFLTTDNDLKPTTDIASPRDVGYVVVQQHDSRIRAKLDLFKTGDPNEMLLSIELDLADSARPGTGQPVRISDLVSVVCGSPGSKKSDIATNGVTHAISRNLLSQGQCHLYIDPCNNHVAIQQDRAGTGGNQNGRGSLLRVARSIAEQNVDQEIKTEEERASALTAEIRLIYNLYGAQNLFVTVERQGVSGKWEGRWTVEPSTWSCRTWDTKAADQTTSPGASNTLPRPSDSQRYLPAEALLLRPPTADQGGGEDMYQIHVQAAARSPQVEYAEGVVVPTGDGIQLLSPEYQFDARLRPSGLFGLGYPRGGRFDGRSARIFVTLPIEGVSLRFPTSVHDLHSTSDSTSVQVVTLRAGALVTLEPWDYNRGENFFAIPLRLQAGGHLIDLGSGKFTPTFLIGISAALPLVQTTVKFAQNTVGLGAFYELDGRDGSSHLLLTLGLNLLSLFSPPAGTTP